MKEKLSFNISERQVEDALVANSTYLQKLLTLPTEVRLIARQLRLKTGEERLDLLLSAGKDLYLVEIKVTDFHHDHIDQISSYHSELLNLQKSEQLIDGKINQFLLVTKARSADIKQASKKDISVIVYSPLDVMDKYYQNLASFIPFLRIRPNDYGVFSLGLINRTLHQVALGETKEDEIAQKVDLSQNSVHNHLKIAKEFGLVRERDRRNSLTDNGDKFFQGIASGVLENRLSVAQIEILKEIVVADPFFSPTVFGIYAILESAFLLARNVYPLWLSDLKGMFRTVAGKVTQWQAPKSLSTATYTFLNYAIDLELLGKIGSRIVITPAGFRFVLMLQLHKSIEMIESLGDQKNSNETIAD